MILTINMENMNIKKKCVYVVVHYDFSSASGFQQFLFFRAAHPNLLALWPRKPAATTEEHDQKVVVALFKQVVPCHKSTASSRAVRYCLGCQAMGGTPLQRSKAELHGISSCELRAADLGEKRVNFCGNC